MACFPLLPLKHLQELSVLIIIDKPIQTMDSLLSILSVKTTVLELSKLESMYGEMPMDFSSILVISNCITWSSPDFLGDFLCDMLKIGKGVVVSTPTTKQVIGGKWGKNKLSPLSAGQPKYTSHLIGNPTITHPIFENVNIIAGSDVSLHVSTCCSTSSTVLARWSDGYPLIAVQENDIAKGKIIGLNLSPIPILSLDRKKDAVAVWGKLKLNSDMKSDVTILIENCLNFVANPTYQSDKATLRCKKCSTIN